MLAQAHKIGRPPGTSAKSEIKAEKLVQHYGGIFHNQPNRFWVILRAILCCLVTPWQIDKIIHANNVSLDAMNEELLNRDLTRAASQVEVPVLFFWDDTIATWRQKSQTPSGGSARAQQKGCLVRKLSA